MVKFKSHYIDYRRGKIPNWMNAPERVDILYNPVFDHTRSSYKFYLCFLPWNTRLDCMTSFCGDKSSGVVQFRHLPYSNISSIIISCNMTHRYSFSIFWVYKILLLSCLSHNFLWNLDEYKFLIGQKPILTTKYPASSI